MGLRELKKQKTRKMVSDLALGLFMEKGYDKVTMADVATAAEVSVSTVFNYFPNKESLVFDLEDEIDADIVGAIRDRKKGQSVLNALHKYFLTSDMFNSPNPKMSAKFMKLVKSSPELSSYFRGMWVGYENSLSREIQRETSASKLESGCMARLILEGVSFAFSSSSSSEALNLAFKTLENGWDR